MANSKSNSVNGLNPCFNGRYSQSLFLALFAIAIVVLILVLMEDTRRERKAVRPLR